VRRAGQAGAPPTRIAANRCKIETVAAAAGKPRSGRYMGNGPLGGRQLHLHRTRQSDQAIMPCASLPPGMTRSGLVNALKAERAIRKTNSRRSPMWRQYAGPGHLSFTRPLRAAATKRSLTVRITKGVRSRPVLARNPSRSAGRYCIRWLLVRGVQQPSVVRLGEPFVLVLAPAAAVVHAVDQPGMLPWLDRDERGQRDAALAENLIRAAHAACWYS
jgi:hypothetical protein